METSDGTPERRPDGGVDFALDWEKKAQKLTCLIWCSYNKNIDLGSMKGLQ